MVTEWNSPYEGKVTEERTKTPRRVQDSRKRKESFDFTRLRNKRNLR
jgi:hypothetical protein